MSPNRFEPLVSVVVVVYDSAAFVLRTLASISRQTYRNVEVIIADDASGDDTESICRRWMEANEGLFVRTLLVRAEFNQGLVGNANAGLRETRGEWIKFVDGDDELLETCLEDNVRHVQTHPYSPVVFSPMAMIDRTGRVVGDYPFPSDFFRRPSGQQLVSLLHRCALQSPSAFFNGAVLKSMGGFDPAFPMMEDFPLWIKMLEQGYLFSSFGKTTVRYRVHERSLSGGRYLSPAYVRTIVDFNKTVRIPMARRRSRKLALILEGDLLAFRFRQEMPAVAWAIYPGLWLWALISNRFNPAAP